MPLNHGSIHLMTLKLCHIRRRYLNFPRLWYLIIYINLLILFQYCFIQGRPRYDSFLFLLFLVSTA
jgi:hypothetical protein